MKISQSARDAAADWYKGQNEDADVLSAFRDGDMDWHPMIQAFAAFEAQAEARGRREGLEMAAKVADERCPTCKQWGDDFGNHCPDPFHWQTTAEAIRALIKEEG